METKNKNEKRLLNVGLNSTTQDHKHILMWDFDHDVKQYNKEDYKNVVFDTLSEVQDKYKLSDIFVLKTKNGYNAFCLDKLPLHIVNTIIFDTDLIDLSYWHIGIEKGYYTLTMLKDKKIIGIIKGCNNAFEKSYAHYIFLTDIMNYKIYFNKQLSDNLLKVNISFYFKDKCGIPVTHDSFNEVK